ncbi:hypothetical protein HK096_010065, partial [Nowakowskiella sp. JEL0078]
MRKVKSQVSISNDANNKKSPTRNFKSNWSLSKSKQFLSPYLPGPETKSNSRNDSILINDKSIAHICVENHVSFTDPEHLVQKTDKQKWKSNPDLKPPLSAFQKRISNSVTSITSIAPNTEKTRVFEHLKVEPGIKEMRPSEIKTHPDDLAVELKLEQDLPKF